MICGIGAAQGTSWTGGNPSPHPWFERKKKKDGGLISVEKFANGQGLQAIRNAEMQNNNNNQINKE